jgi:hypothetical protein
MLLAITFIQVRWLSSVNSTVMAKPTRYNSFEELKSAPLENPLAQAESAKAHAVFEELMRRLQQEFAAQKKSTR